MNLIDHHQYILQPVKARSTEVGRWLAAVQDSRLRTLHRLEGLQPVVLDWMPEQGGNTIGTLLYHLAAIQASWLFEEVLQQNFTQEIEALLPYDIRDDQDQLVILKGVSLVEHLQRLEYIQSVLIETYRTMTAQEFRRPRLFPDYDVTPEWVLHHLMQHEAEHRSQISELRSSAEYSLGLKT